jgi:hypothetical protein
LLKKPQILAKEWDRDLLVKWMSVFASKSRGKNTGSLMRIMRVIASQLAALSLFNGVFLMTTGAATGAPASDSSESRRSAKFFRSPNVFWGRLLTLLNEDAGSITKAQFEDALGVRLGTTEVASDATTYRLRDTPEEHFSGFLTIYNETFQSNSTMLSGKHIAWGLTWKPASFGDPSKGECITTSRVQSDLVATGWTPPWKAWGEGNESGAVSAHLPRLPAIHIFARTSDNQIGAWNRLPLGQLYATGSQPDSCVTGIFIQAP